MQFHELVCIGIARCIANRNERTIRKTCKPLCCIHFATQVDCVICSPARRAASIRQMPRGHVVEFTEPAIDHRTPVFRQNVAAETDSSEVSSERSRKAPLCVKKVSRQTSGRVKSRFGKGKKRTSSSRGLPIAKKVVLPATNAIEHQVFQDELHQLRANKGRKWWR